MLCALLALAGLARAAPGAEPTQPTARALSVRVLQTRIKESLARGERPRELWELAGLTRITGYVVEPTRQELILVGQAAPGAPPLHVEDLAVALRSAWLRYAQRQSRSLRYHNPGCSIDPEAGVLRQLEALSAAAATDAADLEARVARWREVCAQPQRVRVLGVPHDTRFGQVMVEADYLMKRVVSGSLDLGVPGLTSVTAMLMAAVEADPAGAPISALHRFWFCPGEASFVEQEGLVAIQACPVKLLTEEEHLTRTGVAGKGRPHPMAQQFSEQFSVHYQEIAAQLPIYQELEALFRFVAIARLLRYQQARVDVAYLLDSLPVPKASVPRTLPGISHVGRARVERELPGAVEISDLVVPSCGGVDMDIRITPRNFRRATAPGAAAKTPRSGAARAPARVKAAPASRSAVLKARPSPDALTWEVPAGK